MLDEFVGRRVAQIATDDDVRDLRALVRANGRGGGRERSRRLSPDRIWRSTTGWSSSSGNAKLVVTYRRLVNELHLYRRTALAQAGALPLSSHRASRHRRKNRGRASRRPQGARCYDHVIGSRERMHLAARRRDRCTATGEEIALTPASVTVNGRELPLA